MVERLLEASYTVWLPLHTAPFSSRPLAPARVQAGLWCNHYRICNRMSPVNNAMAILLSPSLERDLDNGRRDIMHKCMINVGSISRMLPGVLRARPALYKQDTGRQLTGRTREHRAGCGAF